MALVMEEAKIDDLRNKAEFGDPVAQDVLGTLYFNGKGIDRDYTEAAKWYLRAAAQGNISSQARLITQYFYGIGVAQDSSEAYFWLLVFLKSNTQNGGFEAESSRLEKELSAVQIESARKRAADWKSVPEIKS